MSCMDLDWSDNVPNKESQPVSSSVNQQLKEALHHGNFNYIDLKIFYINLFLLLFFYIYATRKNMFFFNSVYAMDI